MPPAATGSMRIVIVATDQGAGAHRILFATDPTLYVARILETCAGRWGI